MVQNKDLWKQTLKNHEWLQITHHSLVLKERLWNSSAAKRLYDDVRFCQVNACVNRQTDPQYCKAVAQYSG